jgi:hypothetical protein
MLPACAAFTPTIIPTVTNPFDEKVDVGGYALRTRCPPQQVCFCQTKVCQFICNAQYLFLIQDHPKSFIKQWG